MKELITSFIKSPQFNAKLQLSVPFLLAAVLFAVPVSESARSILIGLTVAVILFTPAYRNDLVSTLSQRWCQALLLFFVLALFACMWSPATTHETLAVLKKYIKLLFLPILAVGFRDPRARQFGIYAFLAAMLITCLLSMLKASGFIVNDLAADHVFRNHVVTGLMMAFAAYLSAMLFIRDRGKIRFFYATLVFLFSYQILFINTGRTGYIAYCLLMVLLVGQQLTWRMMFCAAVFGSFMLGICYYNSSTAQHVAEQAVAKIHAYQHNNSNDSIGTRIQFHHFSKKLLLQHPLFGNGTGSYTHLFRVDNPVPSWLLGRTASKFIFEPHSQYWLVAAEFGLLGILVLMFFFGSLLAAGLRLNSMRAVAVASILLFMVGNLSDSLLFYSGTGYFFLMFMGMCLGEQLQLKSSAPISGIEEKVTGSVFFKIIRP